MIVLRDEEFCCCLLLAAAAVNDMITFFCVGWGTGGRRGVRARVRFAVFPEAEEFDVNSRATLNLDKMEQDLAGKKERAFLH